MEEKITSAEYQEGYVKIDMKRYKLSGEIVPTSGVLTSDEVTGITGRAPKGGFEIVRMPFVERMLKEVCEKRGKVLAYLLTNKDEENRVDATTASIAADTSVGISTVRKVIDIMEKYGLAVQTTGTIFINPSLSHKGNYKREGKLFDRFDSMAKKYKKGTYAENGTENNDGLA